MSPRSPRSPDRSTRLAEPKEVPCAEHSRGVSCVRRFPPQSWAPQFESDLSPPATTIERSPTFFTRKGFQLQLISSLALARTREALHNSWDKNDPKDAQVILHLLKGRLTQHYHDPIIHNLNDLQELSKTHHQVSLEKTGTQHRLLTHYLPLYFPEIARYHSSARSEWLWALLVELPDAPKHDVLVQDRVCP